MPCVASNFKSVLKKCDYISWKAHEWLTLIIGTVEIQDEWGTQNPAPKKQMRWIFLWMYEKVIFHHI